MLTPLQRRQLRSLLPVAPVHVVPVVVALHCSMGSKKRVRMKAIGTASQCRRPGAARLPAGQGAANFAMRACVMVPSGAVAHTGALVFWQR